MTPDTSIHDSDVKTIALMVVILAGLVALLALALNDPSIDVTPMPIRSAHAATLSTAARAEAPPAKVPAIVPPEESWAADESSHGLRPDAAH